MELANELPRGKSAQTGTLRIITRGPQSGSPLREFTGSWPAALGTRGSKVKKALPWSTTIGHTASTHPIHETAARWQR